MTGDDEQPSNVFQFPGAKPDPTEDGASNVKFGAFLDKNGPALYVPVANLTDSFLLEWLNEARQHRALTNMLIDLMEIEGRKRGLQV